MPSTGVGACFSLLNTRLKSRIISRHPERIYKVLNRIFLPSVDLLNLLGVIMNLDRVLILVVAFWCSFASCQLIAAECNQVSSDEVEIAMLVEFHEKCSNDRKARPKALALALMAEYGLDLVNRDNSTGLSVPGINYRLTFHDICSNESFGVKTAASLLPTSIWRENTFCTSSGNGTSRLLLGFLGPERSVNAKPLASFVSKLNIPIVSPTSSLAALSNRELYGSFYRTIPSTLITSRALVDMLVELNMRYVRIVHIDTEFGRESAKEAEEHAVRRGVCISNIKEISLKSVLREVAENFQGGPGDVSNLIDEMKTDSMKAIIYFGGAEVKDIISLYLQNTGFPNKKLLLSSYSLQQTEVQSILDVRNNFHNYLEVLFLHPYSNNKLITKFENYTTTRQSGGSVSASPEIDERFRNLNNDDQTEVWQYTMYAQSVLESLYVVLNGFQNVHREICDEIHGVCSELSNAGTDVFYAKMNSAIQNGKLNVSLADELLHLNFEGTSDKQHMTGEIIYSFERIAKDMITVAHYVKDTRSAVIRPSAVGYDTIDISFASICNSSQNDCSKCGAKKPDYVYKKGNSPLLLIGVGNIRGRTSDFSCGELLPATFMRMQAFYYGVELSKNRTSIDFSTLYIDSCSAKLRVNRIFMNLFNNSENISVIDHYGDTHVIPIKYIVAVIGDQSSDDTIYMQNIIKRFKIPMVSDGATSVWLSDRFRYPNFLRTVPADDAQSSIMLDLAKDLGVKHIGLIYTQSVYAQTAIKALKNRAKEINMCISYDEPIAKGTNETDANINKIATEIADSGTDTQAFVYFGEREEIKALLRAMSKDGKLKRSWKQSSKFFIASELWADSQDYIDGFEDFVVGSLTFGLSNDRFPGGEDSFVNYLKLKTPQTEKDDPVFLQAWQKHFKCHLPGQQSEYPQKCDDLCNLGVVRSCSSSPLPYSETFAVQSLMAVLSVGFTLHSFDCDECLHTFNDDSARAVFFEQLRQVRIPDSTDVNVPKYTPFLSDGNGLKDYMIFNIQKTGESAQYVRVYKAVDGILENVKQVLQYNENGHIVSNFQFKACIHSCECLVNEDNGAMSSVQNTECQGGDANFHITLAILVVLVLLLIIAIVLIIICITRRKCLKNNSTSGEAVTFHAGNGCTDDQLSVKFEAAGSHYSNTYDVPRKDSLPPAVPITRRPSETLPSERGMQSCEPPPPTVCYDNGRPGMNVHQHPSNGHNQTVSMSPIAATTSGAKQPTSQTLPSQKSSRNMYVRQPSAENHTRATGETHNSNHVEILTKPRPLTVTADKGYDSNHVPSGTPIPSSDTSLENYFVNKGFEPSE